MLLYNLFTVAYFLVKISARKFPLPQAGSRKRLSIRSHSCDTKSHIFFTSRSAVKTSPWSATRCFDLTCFVTLLSLSVQQNRYYVAFETAIRQNKKAPTIKCRCRKLKMSMTNQALSRKNLKRLIRVCFKWRFWYFSYRTIYVAL